MNVRTIREAEQTPPLSAGLVGGPRLSQSRLPFRSLRSPRALAGETAQRVHLVCLPEITVESSNQPIFSIIMDNTVGEESLGLKSFRINVENSN